MAGFFGQTFETIGMEYESTSMTLQDAQRLISSKMGSLLGDSARNIVFTNDASVQFKASPVKFGSRTINLNNHTSAFNSFPLNVQGGLLMGFELYILPLVIPDFARVIYPLFSVLEINGDYTSHRASIHFHGGFPNNLLMLQNMLRICLHLEPVLFRLGGMGGTHRGYSNQYNYCRPLLNAAVVPVNPRAINRNSPEFPPGKVPRTYEELLLGRKGRENQETSRAGTRWVKIVNPIAALNAKTIEEFWASFGVEYTQSISVKYHPTRYMGCNFFAVPKHKTMEFRHFNQSLDAGLTLAVGKFSRAIAEMAAKLSKREAAQFDVQDPFHEIPMGLAVGSIERIMGLCDEKEIENLPSQTELNILYETIENSHVEPLPDFPIKSHIGSDQFMVDSYLVKLGALTEVEAPRDANQVDIHTISEKSIYDEKE